MARPTAATNKKDIDALNERLEALELGFEDHDDRFDSVDRGNVEIVKGVGRLALLMSLAVSPTEEAAKRAAAINQIRQLGHVLTQVAEQAQARLDAEDEEEDDGDDE